MSRTPDQMNTGHRTSGRGFFWQGALILLPVVVLAVVGFHSLRQDRLLAEGEARQNAQRYADEISRVFWKQVNTRPNADEPAAEEFRINDRGELILPPPSGTFPLPRPVDLAALSDEHRDHWKLAFGTGTDPSARANAITASEKLLASSLPDGVAPLIQYRLSLLLIDADRPAEATVALRVIAEESPESISESGVPIRPLAEFKQLELASRAEETDRRLFERFSSNWVFRPTFLTPRLLSQAFELAANRDVTNEVGRWRSEWERHENLRVLANAALGHAASDRPGATSSNLPPALFWFRSDAAPQTTSSAGDARRFSSGPAHAMVAGPQETVVLSSAPEQVTFTPDFVPERHWLAVRLDDGDKGHWIVCRVLGVVGKDGAVEPRSEFWTQLRDSFPPLPPWLGFSLDVAGRSLVSDDNLDGLELRPSGKGGGQTWQVTRYRTGVAPEVLATSRQVEHASDLLRVRIHLTSPQMLYSRQRSRTLLFGMLIAASAIVALAGFVSARRAFHHQQRLAAMKSNFVSSVSHELRAPIASVRLMAESLERGTVKEPSRQAEYFRFIVQECRRLGTLIENVLDFSRIEQGRKQYEFEPTDVAALLRQTMKLMEPAAMEKNVRLVLEIPQSIEIGSGPAPLLDGQAMQQALVNLIDNALKHSSAGSTVRVGANSPVELPNRSRRREEADDADVRESPPPPVSGYTDKVRGEGKDVAHTPESTGSHQVAPFPAVLQLFVVDEGPGIPAHEHERIFERFYRLGSELRRDTQGVGIGLSIVKHIVEAHGGRVWVESAPGQGSRFNIIIPAFANPAPGSPA